jgi:serine/threonine protein kinase
LKLILIYVGEGHFGEVYNGKLIGHDENNNGITKQTLQHVAIKRLRQTQSSFVDDLCKEGQRMFNLDHPFIVKIFGICKHETSVSLILELCPYGAMNGWLRLNK